MKAITLSGSVVFAALPGFPWRAATVLISEKSSERALESQGLGHPPRQPNQRDWKPPSPHIHLHPQPHPLPQSWQLPLAGGGMGAAEGTEPASSAQQHQLQLEGEVSAQNGAGMATLEE